MSAHDHFEWVRLDAPWTADCGHRLDVGNSVFLVDEQTRRCVCLPCAERAAA